MTADSSTVSAGAEKRFFIEMLTKDIELLPAIVDLVDNSVDGARRLHPDGDLQGQWVHIQVDGDEFRIEDNSGGIEIDIARDYAFRFGRPRAFQGVPKSVGQFGVGMKRAIFKLGDRFQVTSAYRRIGTGTAGDSSFKLEVDVNDWELQEEWTFQFSEFEEHAPLPDGLDAGTTIAVTALHPSVGEDFGDGSVIDELKRELELRHQESLDRGLVLTLNGAQLRPTRPSLQNSPLLSPIRRTFSVPTETGVVDVELFAGTVQGETRRDNIDDVDLGDAESFQDPSNAGWYLFCNDRLLMVADTSYVTGWGNPAAAFHPQYRLFRGYVYLSADDASLLPWNTTKTAVDRDSPVFRVVASQMKSTLVAVQAQINKEKKVRKVFAGEVRDAEARGDATLPARPELLAAFEDADDVPLRQLPQSETMIVPLEPPTRKRTPPPANIKRIQYEVDIEDFESAADILGTHNGSEVGRQTFAYFVEAEVH